MTLKKPRLDPDPFTRPVDGTRGPCSICEQYGDLTFDHVPPQSCGNLGRWNARSFTAAATKGGERYFVTKYPNGISFRTICAECNTRFGHNEDVALSNFFSSTRRIVASPIFLGARVRVTVKPNLIIRSLLAHLLAANDGRGPTSFDLETREILRQERLDKAALPNVYYWHYAAPDLLIIRDMLIMETGKSQDPHLVQMIKIAPLAFLVTSEVYQMHNLRPFIHDRADGEIAVPLDIGKPDLHPTWPAVPEGGRVLLSGDSVQILATKPSPPPVSQARKRGVR